MPTYVYTVYDLPIVSWVSSDLDSTICYTDSVSFTASGTDNYQFFINQSSVTGYVPSGFYWSDTLNNSDTVYFVGKDETTNCLMAATPMIFTVNPLPTTSFTESVGGNVICAGDTVTFTGSGADTYEFFIDGLSVSGPGGATYITSSLITGDTITVLGYTVNGCTKYASESYTYTVNPLPNVSMTLSDADTSICSGNNVSFTASGAALYEFFINGASQGAQSSATTFNSTTLADNDLVYVEGDFSGCIQRSDSAQFTVLTSPTTNLVSDDADATICAEDMVNFTASGATNYEFFIDGISQGPASPTNSFSTTSLTNGQTVSVNGESNTCIVAQGINFTVLSLPSVGLFSDDVDNTICQAEPITFTGANATAYELFVNNISQGPAQASPTFTPTLPNGTNTVYIIGTAGNGCTDTSQTVLNVTVNAIPTVILTSSDADNVICAGETVVFSGTGSDLYQFFIDGISQGSLSATNTLATTDLLDGQVVSITGSTLGCAGVSNTIPNTVNPIPNVTLSSTDIDNVYCIGTSVDYTAAGAANYEFFVDGVSQGPSSPTNVLNSAGFVVGNYLVEVQGEQNNCSNNASYIVTVNGLPTVNMTSSDADNVICTGDMVTYTATGGDLYEFEIDGFSQGAPSPINTFTSTLVNGNVVSVVGTSAQGCTMLVSELPITVNTTPTVTLTSSDIDFQICIGDNVDFTGSGSTDYEFFINTISQGPASTTPTLSTSGLSNNDVIEVVGTTTGCSATSNTLNFTVFNYPVVSLINNGESEICVGENTNLTASGATNYQWLINGSPVGGFSPTTTFTSPLNNGDIVTVNGETNSCAVLSANNYSFVVNTYPTLTSASSDVDNIICLNDLISFTASGASTYTYQLNGSAIQNGATSTYAINTLEDGDAITITGLNGDCPSTSDVYNFTVNSMNLDISIAASNLICEGETATLTATGGDLYEFFLNGVSVGPMSATNTYSASTFSDLDEVTYTAYSNTTLCTQDYNDYTIINVVTEPAITPLSSLDFCEGDSVILVSNGIYGNQWYIDGTPIAGATDTSYTTYTTGVYTLETTAGGLGDIWSFGLNSNGTFGDGTNFNNPEPKQADVTDAFDEISSGADFVLAVNTAGDVYAWGENSSGQLGDGTYTNSNLPTTVPTLSNVKTVATSQTSAMAITNTGDVYVWGSNAEGQLATGNTSVINFPFLNAALANTDSIAGGKDHFVILKNDGTVWAVGNNNYGQLGQGDLIGSSNAVQVSGLVNIVSVGAGEYNSFAIDVNGNLNVWGNNGNGQLGLNDLNNRLSPTLSPLVDVINAQGGANHSAFLTRNNEVFTTGGNTYGQLGTGDTIDRLVPTKISVSGVAMISASQYTTLVKRTDNSVFGFGNNANGQLSSGAGSSINTPEHIADLDGVSFVEAGRSTSHVLYNEVQTCTSTSVNVTMNTVPIVTIIADGDTLRTMAGTNYQWYINGSIIPGAASQSYVANETGTYTVDVTFANGCTGSSSDYYHSMTSIKEMNLGTIELYPNPATEMLNLRFSESLNGTFVITIYDQTGRAIMNDSYMIDGIMSVDVSSLEPGVYHIAVVNQEYEANMRFIKSHH